MYESTCFLVKTLYGQIFETCDCKQTWNTVSHNISRILKKHKHSFLAKLTTVILGCLVDDKTCTNQQGQLKEN